METCNYSMADFEPVEPILTRDFYKLLRPGTHKTWRGRWYSVFIEVEYSEGRLSITGVEGPLESGNCLGGCGQVLDFQVSRFANGWDRLNVEILRYVWRRWHLNDLRAGTALQEWIIRTSRHNGWDWHRIHPFSHYKAACELLNRHSALIDDGHQYGHAWLFESVPKKVLTWLFNLPDADRPCPWPRSK